jgi:hypothetical protein
MMNYKRLALAATVFTAFSLTGCGGGSSSDSSSNSSETFTSYDLESGDTAGYAIQKSTITVKDGVAYNQSVFVVKGGGFDVPADWFQTMITKNATYQPDKTKYELGYKVAFVDTLSDTTRVVTPYNLAGHRALKFTDELVKIDLSGKKVNSVIFVADDYTGLLSNIKNSVAVYPAGSFCYRVAKSSVNQPIIYVDNIMDEYLTLSQWISQQKIDGATTSTDSWSGLDVAFADYTDYKGVAISIDGKIHHGIYDVAGEFGGVNALIDYYQTQLSADPSNEYLKSQLNALKNECSDFNKIATNAIDAVIAQASGL